MFGLFLASLAALSNEPAVKDRKVTVASYYFGNYHPGDSRNTKVKGKDWSEWELVKNAKPRFPGHRQPNLPLWGFEDESQPKVMEKKIAAAADHGIDAFIFDWYYYDDGPFLEKPIDQGFLKAKNTNRIKFAFMWANHDWIDIHPYRRGAPAKLLYPGKTTPETFNKICDLLIKNYFKKKNYWKVNDAPYFSFYDLNNLVSQFGSIAATRKALDEFREKAKKAGFKGLHLNAVVWGQVILPSERVVANLPQVVKELGFDSVTSYVWIHHVGLPQQQTDYNYVRDRYFSFWDSANRDYGVPYFPNVTMGWDSSPRADQSQPFENAGYPFMNTIGNNTPVNFKEALRLTKERLLADPKSLPILNINCWNEWTEGSYLEPDMVNKFGYLEAIKSVFRGKN